MQAKVLNLLVTGLGGQGVLKASDILAQAAFDAGFDVKKSELHGMSQRGGSVWSDVRFGGEVLSPMIPEGEADYLVALASDQVEPHRSQLRPGGVLITPAEVGGLNLPNRRSLNVALLGCLSRYLDLPQESWMRALKAQLSENLFEPNRIAFLMGRGASPAPEPARSNPGS